jgi:hypothetical protein
VLAVYKGAKLSRLTAQVANDDYAGTPQSKVTLTLVPGTTYRIAVDGYDDGADGGPGAAAGAITVHWQVDSNPPQTIITAAPPAKIYSPSTTVRFVADPEGAVFTCQLDTGPAVPCSSPYTTPTATKGKHTLTVTAWIGGVADPTPAKVVYTVSTATFAALSPSSGPVGTPVTITGKGLDQVVAVSFHGTPASFVIVNPTTITTTVPGGATTGKVAVTTAVGTTQGKVFTVS